jgi:cell division septation protein DedD
VCFLPFYLIFKAYQFAWGKPQTQRGKLLSVSGVSIGLLILVIIGSAAGGGSSSPTPITPSPVASVVPVLAQVSSTSATHKAAASKSPARVTTSAAASSSSPAPVHTQAPAATSAPPTTAPTTAAPAAPACSPLTSGGNCYEPGEFCAAKDHDVTGVAGDGKSITCKDVDGWRWED